MFNSFPTLGSFGDLHFDDEEIFTVQKNQPGGVDLKWLALHELGHSLGLEHSSEKRAIMYPIYSGYHPGLQLHRDDILGIQQLYGKLTLTCSTRPNLSLLLVLAFVWYLKTMAMIMLGIL